MSEAKTYETSDLYLTAFLKLKGQKFIVEKVNKKVIQKLMQKKYYFSFEKRVIWQV